MDAFDRMKRHWKKPEQQGVAIVDYRPRHADAFRELNEEWIVANFVLEEADRRVLGDPEGKILAAGGHVLMALLRDEPVGTCALLRMDDPDYDFELAKMAVSPAARGRGLGRLLAEAALDRARTLGARAIYLESNTVLGPAIELYHSLGFERIEGRHTPYERCNIQMALRLDRLA